ncbi:ribonuclease domain-containing protein, partial [Variovorax sp. JS1663]|uniref:ribonuclease domain-containing protein n=1 Tax=Variovorax sp. JS1663 TaxID=1851577 RepID=UPI00192D047B
AASNWCASLPLMAAAVGYVNSTQFAASQPSLADQIPTGYGAGGVRVLDGSTSTSADVVQGSNTTTTPGTAISNSGTPGYGASSPGAGGTSTSIPNGGPSGGIIMMATSGSIPQSAQDVIDYADAHNGAARPGYVGGRTFNNDGRGGGQVLPTVDAQGNPITYTEYDTNRFTPGVNRGAERVVVGRDGSAYYTNDHYATFVRLR